MTDPIIAAARFVAENLEWLRHRQEADEALTTIDACARVVSGIARGPAPQKYLGPCGAVLAETAEPCPGDCSCRSGPRTALSDACAACSCFETCHPIVPTDAEGQICDGDIYARDGAERGRCRTCGAQVATSERRAWLDAEVRAHAFRAAEIANAYGINVKTIRSWATDRQARYDHSGTCVQTARPAKLHPHGWDRDGRPLFLVGDVLDLAAQEAARREEARAERARRAAARETAEMGA
jgi:hypothetical protein